MKLQVPFTMPLIRRMRSPLSPCTIPGITGTPPATDAPKQQLHILFCGQVEQFRSAEGDELLVRGDDVLARTQCGAQPAFDGIEATDELDHRVHIRRSQNIFNTVRPDSAGRHKLRTLVLTLPLHIAVEDPRNLNLLVPSGRKNLSERTANCTKAKQTYTQAALLLN